MKARLIIDGPREPALNMAIDEALLRSVERGGPATIRIYMWRPSGLSLGRREPASHVDPEEARRRGVQLVRRPTGGRALLHAEGAEVTYSVVLPPSHPVAGLDVPRSAAAVARGVALALERIGYTGVAVGSFTGIPGEGGLCYAASAPSDVTVRGVKVSGSAQLRGPRGGLLQHGTLLLHVDPELWSALIPFKPLGGDPWRAIMGILDLDGQPRPRVAEIVDALAQGLQHALGLEAEPGSLTGEELEDAVSLLYGKHLRREWVVEGRPS